MERTKTHESRYASSLIEASLDPLITINPEGKITDMNEAFIRITGVTRAGLTGTDFGIYFTEPGKARKIYKEVFTKGFVTNYPLVVIDGELTDVLFNGSVYRNEKGEVLGAVVVARDVTEQKRIEKELTEARIFAEKAARVAEDAVKSKQQFLSNMSHEIRTPMNAIIGFTKVVLKTDLSDKQKEYVSAIKVSGDALIVLINDILDLAKVDAGKMTFEKTPFRLAQSISAMLQLFETKIQEKNLELKVEYNEQIPETLLGDPVRLHQIILNLVSNAVKFTNKGTITVSVTMLSENDDEVEIEFSILDTGIGIAKSKLLTIFENFSQASSITSRLYGGTGLGLAIVKKLVEAQGGSIYVESTVHRGSNFTFRLNFKKTGEEVMPESETVPWNREPKSARVLVVEDIGLNQLLMKTILDDFGFTWEMAANGRIAIEKLKNDHFDVILMDLQMPEMNGFDATEYIRKELALTTPIIALTADVTTVDLEKCRSVGMNEYIAKPVDEKLLYTKIINVISNQPLSQTESELQNDGSNRQKSKYTNMAYLIRRTKANPRLILEMISLYLEQTPALVGVMKQSYQDQDWDALQATAHKMIPSFSIMGIHVDFEHMARKVQEFASTQSRAGEIRDLVCQLENVCLAACSELEEEFNRIKKGKL